MSWNMKHDYYFPFKLNHLLAAMNICKILLIAECVASMASESDCQSHRVSSIFKINNRGLFLIKSWIKNIPYTTMVFFFVFQTLLFTCILYILET